MNRALRPSQQRRRILIVGSGGGGGDLQPLVVIADGLRGRGHDVAAFGDRSVQQAMDRLGVGTTVAGPEHDLAEQYAAVTRTAARLTPLEQAACLRDRLATDWATRLQPLIEVAANTHRSEVLIASLFSAGPVRLVARRARLPWVAVNSTFYVGPNPPRPADQDFGARAPLFTGYFAPNMHDANCVMHASDRGFDYDFDGLPPHHHYVGPLLDHGSNGAPAWLDEPGSPWVLVTVSSLKQEDIIIAQAAIAGLRELPVRVLVTVGSHSPEALGPLPPNARVEQFVPHGPVLERACLMISHAGHGSVMRALWHAVPMVLVPWARDQGGVAARASHLGVAAVVKAADVTPYKICAAAHAVLVDATMAGNVRRVAGRLRAMKPVGTACNLIERQEVDTPAC
jgi:UDP:flavonoid glycosyltransferase YjiC (YdhE family)